MPTPNKGETQEEFVSRCIPIVMDDGTASDEKQAAAICYAKWEEKSIDMDELKAIMKKERDGEHPASHYLIVEDANAPTTWHLRVRRLDGKPDPRLMGAAWAALHEGYRGNRYEGPAKEEAVNKLRALYKREGMDTPGKSIDEIIDEAEDEVKVGREISARNRQKIQAAHDTMVEMGAVCGDGKSLEMPDDAVIQYGEMVKAVRTNEGVKVGGYLIRFTSEKDVDLTGDFFAADTDYDWPDETPVMRSTYFHHGMDAKIGKRKLGSAQLRRDDFGIWADTILQERDEYEKFIAELAISGKLGWSSGTAGHLMDREPVGKANKITRWPIVEASLTHTPAEPRNAVMPMKSLLSAEPEPEAGDRPAAKVEAVTVETKTDLPIEGKAMEINDELKTLMADVAKSAVEEYRKSEPAPKLDIAVVKDEADQPFKSTGEFFMAVKTAGLRGGEDPRLLPLKVSGMSEGDPSSAGYLVAPEVSAGIQQNMFETGQILSKVAVDTVQGNSMTYNQVDETSRASTRFGGVLGYWMGEGVTKTASAPKFKQLNLKLKKVAALCYATDELLADASALGSWLSRNVPEELRFKVEDAIFNGDGVGKPLGIIGAPGTVSVLRLDASKVQYDDIVRMYARRLGMGPFAWFINRDVLPQLMQLAGTYQYLWLPPGGVVNSPNARLMGLDVIEVEHCATMGTVGDIVLADLSKYQTIQKGGVESASSIHVKFAEDETAFRFVYRIDGAPMLSSAVTPAHGSNTLAPFVTLASASS